MVMLALGSFSCVYKSDPPEAFQDPRYANWRTYSYQQLLVKYPPNHPQEKNLESFSKGYMFAIDRITRELKIPAMTDTTTLFFYSGFGQGREITGRLYPFATDTAIHFWLPSFPGPVIVQYLLPKWSPVEPKYPFLKHGLIALYDFSGQDYHAMTLNFIRDSSLIHLDSLALDATVSSDTERYQTAEAASFDAFVMGMFDVETLKALYETQLPFPDAVRNILGAEISVVEDAWLEYAMTLARKDTTAAK